MGTSILWLSRTLPLPLTAGDRVYSAGLMAAVARAGAHVVCFGLENPDEPMGDFGHLEPSVQWRLIPGAPRPKFLSLLSPLPLVGARFSTAQYRKTIARELMVSAYDAIVLDQYGMGWALFDVQRFARNRPLIVHLAHNFETDLTAEIAKNFVGSALRKFLLAENARKTRRIEQKLVRNCDLLVALTESDGAALGAINPKLQKIVLPPGYSGPKQPNRVIDHGVPRRAIIVGSFSWVAKQMNLERFLEAASVPFTLHAIELHVIGHVPSRFASRLRNRFPWVTFCGFVDDTGRELQNARVAIVPEETGGGFKLKILDYVFGRVPVAALASSLNGIPSQLKLQFMVARDLESLVTEIVETIDNTRRLNVMQNKAFALADGTFDWDANGTKFLKTVESELAFVGTQARGLKQTQSMPTRFAHGS